MQVAGADFRPGIGDSDQRFLQVGAIKTRRPQHRASRCAIWSVYQRRTATLTIGFGDLLLRHQESGARLAGLSGIVARNKHDYRFGLISQSYDCLVYYKFGL
jgi:hypothetical protein